MLAPEAAYWLRQQGLEDMTARTPLGASATSQVTRYTFSCGRSVVWKEQPGMSYDFFQSEADGLSAIRATAAIKVPDVFFVGENGLLMEDLRPANPGASYWSDLGRQLAELHGHPAPSFGFHRDNFIGLSPQPNRLTRDGHEFFAECRLLHQASAALDRGLLSTHQLRQVEYIASSLSHLIPQAPAVLIHGDLWSGNILSNVDGQPAIIDPAAHWGWAMCDLAMTQLFGQFGQAFYESYNDHNQLPEGWDEAVPVLNLYHQLNHLNLFGLTYADSVKSVLDRYATQI